MTPISLSLVAMLIMLPNHATALMAATSLAVAHLATRPYLTSVDASISARSVAEDDRTNGLSGKPTSFASTPFLVASIATRATRLIVAPREKWMEVLKPTRLYALSLSRALNENQSLILEREGDGRGRGTGAADPAVGLAVALGSHGNLCHWRRHFVCTNSCFGIGKIEKGQRWWRGSLVGGGQPMRGRDDCHVRFSYDGSVAGPALQTNFAILPHIIFIVRAELFFTVVFQEGEGLPLVAPGSRCSRTGR